MESSGQATPTIEAIDLLRRRIAQVRAARASMTSQLVVTPPPTKIIDDFDACVVCQNEEVDFVRFTPCGHCACCFDCSSRVDECPVCRAHIRGRTPHKKS